MNKRKLKQDRNLKPRKKVFHCMAPLIPKDILTNQDVILATMVTVVLLET